MAQSRQNASQPDYILLRKRYKSGVYVHRTKSFPRATKGNDHDLVMMTFRVHLKKVKNPTQSRLTFDLEKFRSPDVAGIFQETIVGKFAPLINLMDDDIDIECMITTYNTAVTATASEILGMKRRRKKAWVTRNVLELCDERKDLKKRRNKEERL